MLYIYIKVFWKASGQHLLIFKVCQLVDLANPSWKSIHRNKKTSMEGCKYMDFIVALFLIRI